MLVKNALSVKQHIIDLRSKRRANAKEQQAQYELAAPVAGGKCFKTVFSLIIYSLELLLICIFILNVFVFVNFFEIASFTHLHFNFYIIVFVSPSGLLQDKRSCLPGNGGQKHELKNNKSE